MKYTLLNSILILAISWALYSFTVDNIFFDDLTSNVLQMNLTTLSSNFSLDNISPPEGLGMTRLFINGKDFESGIKEVKLVRSDAPEIKAQHFFLRNVSSDKTVIVADFDLANKIPGDWNLIAVSRVGQIAVSPQVFRVLSGEPPLFFQASNNFSIGSGGDDDFISYPLLYQASNNFRIGSGGGGGFISHPPPSFQGQRPPSLALGIKPNANAPSIKNISINPPPKPIAPINRPFLKTTPIKSATPTLKPAPAPKSAPKPAPKPVITPKGLLKITPKTSTKKPVKGKGLFKILQDKTVPKLGKLGFLQGLILLIK